jgi:hypothetical protein
MQMTDTEERNYLNGYLDVMKEDSPKSCELSFSISYSVAAKGDARVELLQSGPINLLNHVGKFKDMDAFVSFIRDYVCDAEAMKSGLIGQWKLDWEDVPEHLRTIGDIFITEPFDEKNAAE